MLLIIPAILPNLFYSFCSNSRRGSYQGSYQDSCRRIAALVRTVLTAYVLIMSGTVLAHEVRPSIAELHVPSTFEAELTITTNLEALISDIGAEHDDTDDSPQAEIYNQLRQLEPDALRSAFTDFQPRLLDGVTLMAGSEAVPLAIERVEVSPVGDIELPRTTKLHLVGPVPTDATAINFSWSADFGASVLRVRNANNEIGYTQFLRDGASSDSVAIDQAAPQSAIAQFIHFVWVGFTHIVPKGLDHILFVIGLFLLSMRLSTLLWQITVFTVAHSITLALAMLGIVTLPASLVEPAIAASIVYVCVENLLTDSLNRWRLLVVFAFGLLHGLGFASVLTDFGLDAGQFVTGLIGFNVGVELGQIGVVLACLSIFGWFSNKRWYRSAVTRPASIVIGLVGVWWFVERVFLAPG